MVNLSFMQPRKPLDYYDAECYMLNPTDYRLYIKSAVKGSFMRKALHVALKRAKSDEADKEATTQGMQQLKRVDLDEMYYNMINASIQGILRQEQKNAREAGYVFNTHTIKKVWFEREGEDWKLHIQIEGVYSKL